MESLRQSFMKIKITQLKEILYRKLYVSFNFITLCNASIYSCLVLHMLHISCDVYILQIHETMTPYKYRFYPSLRLRLRGRNQRSRFGLTRSICFIRLTTSSFIVHLILGSTSGRGPIKKVDL